MTATAHALIGASIAATIANPVIGIPLAFASHFLADLVPHWDIGTNHREKSLLRSRIEATLDVLLGFALAFLIFSKFVSPLYLFVIIIASQLPDWLGTPYWLFNLKFPPFSWAYYVGHKIQSRMQLPWGLVTQIAIVGIIVALSLSLTPQGIAIASLI